MLRPWVSQQRQDPPASLWLVIEHTVIHLVASVVAKKPHTQQPVLASRILSLFLFLCYIFIKSQRLRRVLFTQLVLTKSQCRHRRVIWPISHEFGAFIKLPWKLLTLGDLQKLSCRTKNLNCLQHFFFSSLGRQECLYYHWKSVWCFILPQLQRTVSCRGLKKKSE